jgi:hypothetical protein
MEDFDLSKSLDEVINTTYPPKQAALKKLSAGAHFAGVNLAALAFGRAGLAPWPQSLLPTGRRA